MHLACPRHVGTPCRAASQPLMLGRGRKRGLRGRFSSMHDLGLIFCTCMCNFSCSILDYRLQSRPSLTHCSKNSNFFYKNYFCWLFESKLTFLGDLHFLEIRVVWILHEYWKIDFFGFFFSWFKVFQSSSQKSRFWLQNWTGKGQFWTNFWTKRNEIH